MAAIVTVQGGEHDAHSPFCLVCVSTVIGFPPRLDRCRIGNALPERMPSLALGPGSGRDVVAMSQQVNWSVNRIFVIWLVLVLLAAFVPFRAGWLQVPFEMRWVGMAHARGGDGEGGGASGGGTGIGGSSSTSGSSSSGMSGSSSGGTSGRISGRTHGGHHTGCHI
jgi:hypothetical protein